MSPTPQQRRGIAAQHATFNIDRALLHALRARAKNDNVSISAYVEYALKRALDDKATDASAFPASTVDASAAQAAQPAAPPVIRITKPLDAQAVDVVRAACDALQNVINTHETAQED